MSNASPIHQLGTEPNRQVLQAAAALLDAVCRQFPGAARDIFSGVRIEIVTASGARLIIQGSANTSPNGLIVPGGN